MAGLARRVRGCSVVPWMAPPALETRGVISGIRRMFAHAAEFPEVFRSEDSRVVAAGIDVVRDSTHTAPHTRHLAPHTYHPMTDTITACPSLLLAPAFEHC